MIHRPMQHGTGDLRAASQVLGASASSHYHVLWSPSTSVCWRKSSDGVSRGGSMLLEDTGEGSLGLDALQTRGGGNGGERHARGAPG